MSHVPDFVAYAAAFEKAYENDDWSSLTPYFTEDAVYEVRLGPPLGGRFEGRDAILGYFADVLNRFDRRFASRELALIDGPTEEGDSVWIRGSATYRAEGVPAFLLTLEETTTFEGDRIRRLEDRYEPEMAEGLATYLAEHGPKLGITWE